MKFTSFYLGLLVVATIACKQKQEITSYGVAKEAGTAPPAAKADPHAGMPGMGTGGKDGGDPHAGVPGMGAGGGDPHAGVPGMGAGGGDPHAGLTPEQLAMVGGRSSLQIKDEAPPHWKKMPGSAMRQASYQIEGEGGASVDVSLIILRGAAGGTLDNVNRWRGQLGQQPVDEETLKKTAATIETGIGPGTMVEIAGLTEGADAKKDGRLLGVIADKGGDAWFYKMRGNDALTATEKDHFLKWVHSVKPGEAGPDTKPAAGAATTTPAPDAKPPGDGSVTWTQPDGWKVATGASAMRYSTLEVTAADGTKGEMAVTHFPGDVGGDLENVNRWRQQVELPPVEAAGLAPLVTRVTAGPKTLSVVDMSGPKTRVAAAWVRHGADTWFFKFTGPDALVAAEKAKFLAMIESVRFNKPE